MKLTLAIKLLPTPEQAALLLETLREANAVCDAISAVAWEKRIFNTFKLHHEVYHPFRGKYRLSAEMTIRQIAKVADTYKLDKKTVRTFRPFGAIDYNHHILNYKPDNTVSIWAIGGRQKMPFVCHRPDYIPFIKGEANLVYKKGKFYLHQTIDVPDTVITNTDSFIGADFGITDIIVTSDNIKHTADGINAYREKRNRVRGSIQAKAATSKRSTKRNCRKLAKRLQGREKTHCAIVNHTIAKSLVLYAKKNSKGIAIEDLTNIRTTSKRRNKKFRTKLGRWSFAQLRLFIEYKGLLHGVKVVAVNPRYTSQTCHECKYIGKRSGKVFKCTNTHCCVDSLDADYNAAKVISQLGRSVNNAEKSVMYCALHT